MKLLKIIFTSIFLLFHLVNVAQEFTQTIRGSVNDHNTKEVLIGVVVNAKMGAISHNTISDESGRFRFDNLPIGRYTISLEYLGYEKATASQIELTSGKEIILELEMIEKVTTTKIVTIRAKKNKLKTNNQMVAVSGRTFSIEESQRYAGSRGDVARMAQNFAGVQGADDSRNDIIVRGNSPIGVLYRLEGVDIPNPNHFSAAGTTGGPVSLLNNNVMKNSDFLSGAFPAEYGNALAAVFDLGLRKGNDEKHEFLGQLGFAGLEIMAEGPLKVGSNASYLVNYRYSALGFFSVLGINFGTGTAIPKYQDLSFHFNFPDKKGSTKLFGVGGLSNVQLFQSENTGDNLFREGKEDLDYTTNTGIIGVSRTQRIDNKTFARFTAAIDIAQTKTQLDTFDTDNAGNLIQYGGFFRDNSSQGKLSLNLLAQRKISSQLVLKAGTRFYNYFFSLSDSLYRSDINTLTNQPIGWVQPTNIQNTTSLVQSFSNALYRITSKLSLTAGINHAYFAYNGSTSIEPRTGFSAKLSKKYTLNGGYGLHSQLPPFRVYFLEPTDEFGNKRRINQNLGFTKSHHIILGHDVRLGKNARLKVETYGQFLFDVPLDATNDTFYSLLNQGADFGINISDSLVNEGKGTNYGIEVTLEKFLSKGVYFLGTGSFFRSFYTDNQGELHPTVFDSRYAVNVLGGKEFYFKEKKIFSKKIKGSLTTDFKFTLTGGRRFTPVNESQSQIEQAVILNTNQIFANQYDDYLRFDFRIAYKIQSKKVTQEWGIDLQNVSNRRNVFNQTYDLSTGSYKINYQTGLLPIGIYRITF